MKGKVVPITKTPNQLRTALITKAGGLHESLKISTLTETVAPPEREDELELLLVDVFGLNIRTEHYPFRDSK